MGWFTIYLCSLTAKFLLFIFSSTHIWFWILVSRISIVFTISIFHVKIISMWLYHIQTIHLVLLVVFNLLFKHNDISLNRLLPLRHWIMLLVVRVLFITKVIFHLILISLSIRINIKFISSILMSSKYQMLWNCFIELETT